MSEFGLYLGSSKWFSFRLLDPDGDVIPINTSNLKLRVYRPDGSLYAEYTTGFVTRDDGSVIRLVTIDSDEMPGYWCAVWEYDDGFGHTWVEEMPFVVNRVG